MKCYNSNCSYFDPGEYNYCTTFANTRICSNFRSKLLGEDNKKENNRGFCWSEDCRSFNYFSPGNCIKNDMSRRTCSLFQKEKKININKRETKMKISDLEKEVQAEALEEKKKAIKVFLQQKKRSLRILNERITDQKEIWERLQNEHIEMQKEYDELLATDVDDFEIPVITPAPPIQLS